LERKYVSARRFWYENDTNNMNFPDFSWFIRVIRPIRLIRVNETNAALLPAIISISFEGLIFNP